MNNQSSTIDLMLGKASRYDASSVLAVTRKLLLAAPHDLDARSRAALREVRDAGAAVQQVLTDRERGGNGQTKPASVAHANAWNALYGRLSAAARLPEDVLPKSPIAQRVIDTYFKDGLGFLVGGFQAVFLSAERKLGLIDEDGIASDIDSVAGAQYLAHVRTTHQALGDALGLVGEPHPFADGAALQAKIVEASQAIARYARAIIGGVDERDEAAVQRYFAVLGALIEHRQSFRHGADDPSPEPSSVPTSPAPDAAAPATDTHAPLPPAP